MTQWVIAGTLAGTLALGGAAVAQQAASTPEKTPQTTAEQKPKPAPKPHATASKATDQGEARTPKQQPNTAPTPDVPTAAMALGDREHPARRQGGRQAASGRDVSGAAHGR